jgi:elongator complex protein 1
MASWEKPTFDSKNETETIVDFRYLSSNGTICCILSGGDIVVFKGDTMIPQERVQVIGNVEGGILAAEWTIDEEVLAIASGNSL